MIYETLSSGVALLTVFNTYFERFLVSPLASFFPCGISESTKLYFCPYFYSSKKKKHGFPYSSTLSPPSLFDTSILGTHCLSYTTIRNKYLASFFVQQQPDRTRTNEQPVTTISDHCPAKPTSCHTETTTLNISAKATRQANKK